MAQNINTNDGNVDSSQELGDIYHEMLNTKNRRILPQNSSVDTLTDLLPTSGRRQQRKKTSKTVRKNFSLSSEVARAIQDVADMKKTTASKFLEDLMLEREDIKKIIEQHALKHD